MFLKIWKACTVQNVNDYMIVLLFGFLNNTYNLQADSKYKVYPVLLSCKKFSSIMSLHSVLTGSRKTPVFFHYLQSDFLSPALTSPLPSPLLRKCRDELSFSAVPGGLRRLQRTLSEDTRPSTPTAPQPPPTLTHSEYRTSLVRL